MTQMYVNFLTETMETRRAWNNTFKVQKEKYCQLRILCSIKVSSME